VGPSFDAATNPSTVTRPVRVVVAEAPPASANRERVFLDMLATYRPQLRRIAGSYARGAEREDLLQEVLLQLWRSLPGFRGDAALGTWMYRVALNTALTWSRNRSRRPVEVQEPDGEEHGAHPAAAAAPGREDAILDDFLASLGEVDRSLLILHLDGLAPRAIGEVLGLTPGNVSVRLHRIRRRYEQRYLEVTR
jgi:RNA polymerase sigma-70 factor, ECF subfamily